MNNIAIDLSTIPNNWRVDRATGDLICYDCGKMVFKLFGIYVCDCKKYMEDEDAS